MAEKRVTTMVIKVDLECEICRKKIKQLLCKIPQIQNQEYEKKTGTVIITVVCCSPEKIKKKIWCEGGETVQSIEINVPPPPPPPPPVQGVPVLFCPKTCCSKCYQWCGGGPCLHGCGRPTPPCKEHCGRPTPLCYEPCGRPCFDSCGRCSCSCRSKGYYYC